MRRGAWSLPTRGAAFERHQRPLRLFLLVLCLVRDVELEVTALLANKGHLTRPEVVFIEPSVAPPLSSRGP